MYKEKINGKDIHLTPEEGALLCTEARASVEYGMDKFPEVDEANKRLKESRFHKWVEARNSDNGELIMDNG